MLFSTMLADVGTPLMWLDALQLYGGNLLIAALEAWIIRRFFKPNGSKRRVFWIMALSNYFSMLCGMFLLFMLGELILRTLGGEDALYILPRVIALMFAISYLLTLILEWPFCFWALGKRPNRFRESLKADLATQTASYLILLPLVLLASGFSLVTTGHPDRTFVSQAPDIATIYYLSPDSKSLWKVRLNGAGHEKVKDIECLEGQTPPHSLYMTRPAGQQSWDLCTEQGKLLGNIPDKGAVALRDHSSQDGGQGGPYATRSNAATLGTKEDNPWHVGTGIFPSGISATRHKTGERTYLGLETPFVMWRFLCPSLLPGDLVVYQLDRNIVLLDLASRRIGVIAAGYQPVVIVDENAVPRATTQPATSKIAAN